MTQVICRVVCDFLPLLPRRLAVEQADCWGWLESRQAGDNQRGRTCGCFRSSGSSLDDKEKNGNYHSHERKFQVTAHKCTQGQDMCVSCVVGRQGKQLPLYVRPKGEVTLLVYMLFDILSYPTLFGKCSLCVHFNAAVPSKLSHSISPAIFSIKVEAIIYRFDKK